MGWPKGKPRGKKIKVENLDVTLIPVPNPLKKSDPIYALQKALDKVIKRRDSLQTELDALNAQIAQMVGSLGSTNPKPLMRLPISDVPEPSGPVAPLAAGDTEGEGRWL